MCCVVSSYVALFSIMIESKLTDGQAELVGVVPDGTSRVLCEGICRDESFYFDI